MILPSPLYRARVSLYIRLRDVAAPQTGLRPWRSPSRGARSVQPSGPRHPSCWPGWWRRIWCGGSQNLVSLVALGVVRHGLL